MLRGTIIENSLKNPSILESLKIEKTWQDGSWTLHNVLVDEDTALKIGSNLIDGRWYIHFWKSGDDNVLVVFKDRNFLIKYSDKSTWTNAITYGKSIGIPGEQLDFLIRDEEQEIMDRLKAEGYDNVYAYDAEPKEVDEEHYHDFDTKLHVLSGIIRIKMVVGGALTDFSLKAGDEKEILRNQVHSAKVGSEDCRYIVAERH
jgi:hypothetical protein